MNRRRSFTPPAILAALLLVGIVVPHAEAGLIKLNGGHGESAGEGLAGQDTGRERDAGGSSSKSRRYFSSRWDSGLSGGGSRGKSRRKGADCIGTEIVTPVECTSGRKSCRKSARRAVKTCTSDSAGSLASAQDGQNYPGQEQEEDQAEGQNQGQGQGQNQEQEQEQEREQDSGPEIGLGPDFDPGFDPDPDFDPKLEFTLVLDEVLELDEEKEQGSDPDDEFGPDTGGGPGPGPGFNPLFVPLVVELDGVPEGRGTDQVPLPGTLSLLGLGLTGLAMRRRRTQ